MSKQVSKRMVSGVLWMLLATAAGQPAFAAESGQTSDAQGVYTTQDVTVQAKRPVWEETLSPGTVTVIRPEEFMGEQ